MQGKHILDVALVIALLVQATKLSEFVFSDKQRKVFQNQVETFTLYLEGLKPEKYVLIMFEERFSRILALMISSALLAASFYFLPGTLEIQTPLKKAGLVAAILVTGAIAFKIYGQKLFKWVLQRNFWIFLLRLLLLFTTLSVFGIIGDVDENWRLIVLFALWLTGFGFVSYIVYFYGLLVIVYRLLISLLIIFLKVMRWFAWRVVSYNKGAVAAITLVITFVLGIIDVLMKSKN